MSVEELDEEAAWFRKYYSPNTPIYMTGSNPFALLTARLEVYVEVLRRLDAAGITYTNFCILGMGGKGRGIESGLATARMFNQVRPVRITTTGPSLPTRRSRTWPRRASSSRLPSARSSRNCGPFSPSSTSTLSTTASTT